MQMKRVYLWILGCLLGCALGLAGEGGPLFLVTNDDGFDQPGIVALVKALQKHGTVLVVAPKNNASGVGHGIDYRDPIFFGNAPNIDKSVVFWVDAKPATCVQWGIKRAEKLHGKKPDLVLSGINMGENLGMAVYYSGTVGGAREGALHGIPSIAVSSVRRGADYDGAAEWACRFILKYLAAQERPLLVNMNFPSGHITENSPVAVTSLTRVMWDIDYEERVSPQNGSRYCWVVFGSDRTAKPYEQGSDAAAVYSGTISITPVLLDATQEAAEELLTRISAR